jgi:GNAT superfamily N-acetyltransferase
VRRALEDGYELDDDPDRIDVAAVHRFLDEESYWARGRPRDVQERLVRQADRVVGLYHGDRQVGFARVVSDGVAIAYLADVYIEADARGHGLGTEMIREAVERGPHAGLGWVLHTEDAHGVYAKLGFRPPGPRVMERPKPAV